MRGEANWKDPDVAATLRRLWDEGHSTAEIGRRMERSKNSVVGAAHRMGLATRPSPIGRGNAGLGAGKQNPSKERKPERLPISGPTLPPLSSESVQDAAVRPPPAPAPARPAPAEPPEPRREPSRGFVGVRAPLHDREGCPWIEGEPSRKANRCGADRLVIETPDGTRRFSSYCNEHHERAYQKRRAEAA